MNYRVTAILILSTTFAVLASGCDGNVSVTLRTGSQDTTFSADGIDVPAELLDTSSGTPVLASVPCDGTIACPSSDSLTLSCIMGSCDPEAIPFSAPVGEVVDIEALLREARTVSFAQIDSIEFLDVSYNISSNSLTLGVDDVEIYWGPEAATALDPAQGVQRFGTVPAIAAAETGGASVILDPAGSRALGDYLLGPTPRVRFFASTLVDLNPGDPVPAGEVTLGVSMTLRANGSLL